MDEPHFLGEARVAIIGLGLMGGSLAMALRGHCTFLTGIDPNPATRNLAAAWGLVDRLEQQPGKYLSDIDLVVIATPVKAILAMLSDLPDFLPGGAVVLDLGSTKAQIVARMHALPPHFQPVGGHPMCGKETSGLESASADLYRDAPFALVRLERTAGWANDLVIELVRTLGARPVWLDAATHDRWTAATSHFPYLLSNLLASGTPAEAALLVGPGFRSTARVGQTPVSTMLEVLQTNRDNVLSNLRVFRRRLEQAEAFLERQDLDGLQGLLEEGVMAGETLLRQPAKETYR